MSFLNRCRSFIKLFIRINRHQRNLQTRSFSLLTQHSSFLTSKCPFTSLTSIKLKSKGSNKKQEVVSEEEVDEEEGEIADYDSLLVDKNTKIVSAKVNSMRVDVVLKSSLSIARNKVEELFYESKIRVNGKKILKKSELVQEGDEIDIIKQVDPVNPNFINVARVEILQVVPKNQALSVRVRRCKNLTIENYEDEWKPNS